MTPLLYAPRVLLVSLALVAVVPASRAQIPSCGATDRHFDPDEIPAAPVGSGAVYYIDGSKGSDLNDGLSEATAFKTIHRAVSGSSAPIGPGDTVRIKAGLYRESLSIRKSGNASARIMIGAYGNGPVVVDASRAVTGWILYSGQIYKAKPGFIPTAVVVDDEPLFPEFSRGALTEGRWYYSSSTGDLYLWATGGGSPATHDLGVVTDDASVDGIVLQSASYVTLYGLTVRFAGGHGIGIVGDYARVEKSRLLFNGKHGIVGYPWGSITSTNLQVVKNEVYHNFLRNWPRGRYKSGGWGSGVGSRTPNALYQGNVVHKNGGEGLLSSASGGSLVVRDNLVYDNWSVNVYLDNRPNARVENNFIYCHAPDPQDLYNNKDPDPSDHQSLKRLRAEGVLTADEDYGLTPAANLHDVTIQNNVIVDCRRGIGHYAAATGSGLKNVKVLHNTIVVPSAKISDEATLVGISIPYNGGNNSGSVYRNNVVYANEPTTYVLSGGDSTGSNPFLGLTLDHNLWHHSGRSKAFHWGAFDYTHDQWLALSGTAHGHGDVTADPLLVSPSSLDRAADKMPIGVSPALNSGVAAGVTLDYDFCPRPEGAALDMGAYELATGVPLPSLSIGNATATEGTTGTTARPVFTVSLSAPSAHPVYVKYTTAPGTAAAGIDYLTTSGTLTFLPGTVARALAVTVNGDAIIEPNETFAVNLSAPEGATLADAQGLGTILNDDIPPGGFLQFSSPTYTVAEAGGSATITVVRTGKTPPVTVHYLASSGTATVGSDFTATAGTLSFGAGATSATFAVPIVNDTLVEGDETVGLRLSLPTGGAILGARSSATLTIHSDDRGGVIAFSSPTLVVSEVGLTALVTVTRTGGAASGVSVHYATRDGTATGGLDYVPSSGTLLFGAGVARATFAIPIRGDTVAEADETVNLALTAPAGGATLGVPSTAVVTITEKSVVDFTMPAYSVLESSPGARIYVKRTGGTTKSVSVQYAASNGTAIAGADYTAVSGTLTFPVGVAMASFLVPILNDAVHEANETVYLKLLAAGPGAALGPTRQAILTIADNDP